MAASEIGVPDTVMAAEPGARVWPLMMKSEAVFSVKACPAKVRTVGAGAGAGVGRAMVEVPATRYEPESAREMGVPETVMTPPGVKVWVPATRPDAALPVKV